MKPLYLKKHTRTDRYSFSYRHVNVPHMYDKYHFHEEIELNTIISGKGTRFIGNSIEPFDGKDLVMVGSNLPHVWVNDKIYYKGHTDLKAEVINILFLNTFLGEGFLHLPEMHPLKDLFDRSGRGLVFFGETRKRAIEQLIRLSSYNESDRLVGFIQVLNMLAQSTEYNELLTSDFSNHREPKDIKRINKVYQYIFEHFTNKIHLEDVAEIACMNPSAFCRYFKKITKKTFNEFLTEIRINYACKLLLDEEFNITQIALECGFNNPALFYKKFKSITGFTPKTYKKIRTNINMQNTLNYFIQP